MPIHVLLVDEDDDVLTVTETFLERERNIEVTPERDPVQALERVETGEFDCVVSDYSMPKMDGITLCERVQEQTDGLPFFMFSARDPREVKEQAQAAGVTTYLQKGTGTDLYDQLAEEIRAAVE